MRRYLFLAALSAAPALAGCATEGGGDIYGPPCAIRAYEAGYCPTPGYRVPVTESAADNTPTAFGGPQGERHRTY